MKSKNQGELIGRAELLSVLCAGMCVFSVQAARPDYDQPNYDVTKIAPYTLEDPLTFVDGTRVKSPADWPRRRAEIVSIFAREMYGQPPPAPEAVVCEKFEEGKTMAGFGIRRQYRMWFKKDKSGPYVDWLVLLPAKAKGPVPVISFLNYDGNHELIADKEVVLPEGCWLRFADNHQANPKTRGVCTDQNRDSFVLPAHVILARGYAIMSACYGQISPDPDCKEADPAHRQDPFAYTRLFDLWPKRDPNRDDNITALGAWAWVLSRGLDLAETIPEINARKAVVTGYSRLGKTALLAASRDERFAVCVPNQTGGGGCPLAKRDWGENVGTEMAAFTHWFCKAYKKYEKDPANLLTFDQHLLLASIAPRGLLVQGFDVNWFDPEGEYLSCKAASPAWELFGLPGLPDHEMPADYDTCCIGPRLGFVRRDSWHGHVAHDWNWLLDFSDRILKDR